jgi:hypothetical protein
MDTLAYHAHLQRDFLSRLPALATPNRRCRENLAVVCCVAPTSSRVSNLGFRVALTLKLSRSTVSFTQQVISALDSLDVALADFQQEVMKQGNVRRTAASTAAHAASTTAMQLSATATPTATATNMAPSSSRALQWSKEAQVAWSLLLWGKGARKDWGTRGLRVCALRVHA